MERAEQMKGMISAALKLALEAGQGALFALLPLLPAGAQERLEIWAPVFASLARLLASARALIGALGPLLIDGSVDQAELELRWTEAIEEGQSLANQLPESERWLDGLEVVDGWASSVMADERGMAVVTGMLGRLEVKVNAWVHQIIEAMMAPQTEVHAEQWLARLAWAERVVQRFIDEVVMPRVFEEDQ